MLELVKSTTKNGGVEDDLKIIRTWVEYSEDRKTAQTLMYEFEMEDESGCVRHLFKAIKMVRIVRLPKSAKQSNTIMFTHARLLQGVWQENIKLITMFANILTPVPFGLLFLYGVQGVAESEDMAKEIANNDYVALVHLLQGSYRVLEFKELTYQELEWLREKMFSMKNLSVVRGIPKAKITNKKPQKDKPMGVDTTPDEEGTTEDFIAGMSDKEYVVQVLSTPIKAEHLERWLAQTAQEMTEFNSKLKGNSNIGFNLSVPMMFMANLGASEGWSHSYTESTSDSVTLSESLQSSFSTSMGQTIGQSFGETIGHSYGDSYTESIGESYSTGFGTSTGTSWGDSIGSNQGVSQSFSENLSTGNSYSEGISSSRSISVSGSSSETFGTSETVGVGSMTNESISNSSTEMQSMTASNSQTTNSGWSSTSGTTHTDNVSNSSSVSMGRSWSHSEGTMGSRGGNSSYTTTSGENWSESYQHSRGGSSGSTTGQTLGGSGAIGGAVGGEGDQGGSPLRIGIRISSSSSVSTNTSSNNTSGYDTSGSYDQSVSNGNTWTNSWEASNTTGQSFNASTSSNVGESWSSSHTVGLSGSSSMGRSISDTVSTNSTHGTSSGASSGLSSTQGTSHGINIGRGSSDSATQGSGENWGQTNSHSQGLSVGQNQSVSGSQNVGGSSSVSTNETWGLSRSVSKGSNTSDSFSQSATSSDNKTFTQNQGISGSQGWSRSTGSSEGQSHGTTGGMSRGTSSSVGVGPSLGFGISYQWLDQEVKNILTLLDFQNQRLMTALRGNNGAFFTDVYIATPDRQTQEAASILAKAAWMDESSMVCPLQVLNLKDEEQKHLLYHFSAFSADNTKVNDNRQMQSYKYSTVLLPIEYTAYTHLPRISDGGIYADVGDVPKFAVPSMRKGDIYMGKILSGERWLQNEHYESIFEYRIDESELMHGIFTGESRSGKTVAATRFIVELTKIRRKKTGKRLRIVALDPKQDWRILGKFVEPERFHFYSLGNPEFLPINLNICKVPHNVNPQVWVDGIIEIFCRSYGLLERGKAILAETFYALYDDAGVFEDSPNWRDFVPERSANITMAKVFERMQKIKLALEDPKISKKGRMGNEAMDAYACILDRLQVFGRKFSIETKLFAQPTGIAVDELIGEDDVIVLESYGLETTFKNFIFGCITSGFFKYAQGHEGGFLAEDQYETVLIIEEANEVLTGSDTAGSGGGASMGLGGQSEFEKILDQSAGLGLFIIAITQKIADMPSSCVANAGLIFAGKISRADDVTLVIRKIAREERYDDRDILKWFPRSPIGWFVCRSSRNFDFKETEPTLVHIDPLGVNPPTNVELEGIMVEKKAMALLNT